MTTNTHSLLNLLNAFIHLLGKQANRFVDLEGRSINFKSNGVVCSMLYDTGFCIFKGNTQAMCDTCSCHDHGNRSTTFTQKMSTSKSIEMKLQKKV